MVAQIFGLASLAPLTLVALYYFLLEPEKRPDSRSRKTLLVLSAFFAGMVVLYVVASRPWYQSANRVQEGIDLVVEVSGQEPIGDNNYGLISINARRPQRAPVCFPSDVLQGSAGVSFPERLTDEVLEGVAAVLRNDGFSVFLVVQDELDPNGLPRARTVVGFRGQESREFSVGSDEANRVNVRVNRICDEEDLEFRSLNASIVDSFASR